MNIDFSKLEEALESLEDGLKAPPKNDLERDGVIQRFEYTFELAWKTGKKVLDQVGLAANSPRDVIRTMGQQEWVNAEEWLGYLEARNSVTHIYDARVAGRVFESAKSFAPACRTLFSKLKEAR